MMGREARELMLSGQGDKALQLFKVAGGCLPYAYISTSAEASPLLSEHMWHQTRWKSVLSSFMTSHPTLDQLLA